MTVFKTFFKILNKNKFVVIMYTSMLLIFSFANMQSADNNVGYVDEKPNIVIVNNDESELISSFVKYVESSANVFYESDEDLINDGLFYRNYNYIVYIPDNFTSDFMSGRDPVIDFKATGNYESELASRIVTRYFNVASIYQKSGYSISDIVNKTEDSLSSSINTSVLSKLDSSTLHNMSFYFDFASYSITAGLVYIVCIIISVFNDEKIRKRTVVSSINYKKNNRILLLSNCIFAFIFWLFYVLIAFILFKGSLFETHGLFMILNAFLFTICATCLAFMIANLIHNKDAINGIVNVIAIGLSFMCGAFVPVDFLPDGVLTFAHIFPTYYYINTNEVLKTMEEFDMVSLKPILINYSILIGFSILFIVISNIASRKKRKFG